MESTDTVTDTRDVSDRSERGTGEVEASSVARLIGRANLLAGLPRSRSARRGGVAATSQSSVYWHQC